MQNNTVSDAVVGMPTGIPNSNMMGVPNMTPSPTIPAPQIMNPEGAQQFCLRWNSYPATVATQLAALRATEDFVDVTLACDGRQLKAHKLVLSACSPYFMQLLKSTPCQHPVIFLRDVGFRQLVALLEFMYAGEVNVSQVELPALLRTAESLQVRGLADTTANNNNNNTCAPQQPKPTFSPSYGQAVGPPPMSTTPPAPLPMEPTTCSEPMVTDTPSAASTSPKQTRREERSVNLGNERHDDDEENSSDSNESHEEFETADGDGDGDGDQDMKPAFLPDESAPDQVEHQEVDNFDGGDEPEEGQVPLNQTNVGSSITGSQSEDETSEEEDDDDDDGEYKDYQFDDRSYKPGPDSLPDLDGSANGDSAAGPSGAGGPSPDGEGSGGGKEDGGSGGTGSGGSGGGSCRNRLSRSLWPPGIPYHGPQQCPYCPRILSNVGNWRKHVLTMHFARDKVYKCNHCASAFRTPEYLQKHYVRVHNYPQKMTRRKYVEQT